MVATLARQVLQKIRNAPEAVRKILVDVGLDVKQRNNGTRVSTWWDLLEASIRHLPERKTIILVDGIDVLPGEVRTKFLLNLGLFAGKMELEKHHGKLLVATRGYPDIVANLGEWPTIDEEKERTGELCLHMRNSKC